MQFISKANTTRNSTDERQFISTILTKVNQLNECLQEQRLAIQLHVQRSTEMSEGGAEHGDKAAL